ncbi:MAG: hypothetical protein HYY02_02800 [Chloroflexi bacterium]|nr:hypothetical protein [Chloroflexota bacterium]
MLVRGEVVCLNCGRFLGQLEGERERPYWHARVAHPAGGRKIIRTASGLRCGYCGGRAFIENLERVPRVA